MYESLVLTPLPSAAPQGGSFHGRRDDSCRRHAVGAEACAAKTHGSSRLCDIEA